jgi:hypothetical protein
MSRDIPKEITTVHPAQLSASDVFDLPLSRTPATGPNCVPFEYCTSASTVNLIRLTVEADAKGSAFSETKVMQASVTEHQRQLRRYNPSQNRD